MHNLSNEAFCHKTFTVWFRGFPTKPTSTAIALSLFYPLTIQFIFHSFTLLLFRSSYGSCANVRLRSLLLLLLKRKLVRQNEIL